MLMCIGLVTAGVTSGGLQLQSVAIATSSGWCIAHCITAWPSTIIALAKWKWTLQCIHFMSLSRSCIIFSHSWNVALFAGRQQLFGGNVDAGKSPRYISDSGKKCRHTCDYQKGWHHAVCQSSSRSENSLVSGLHCSGPVWQYRSQQNIVKRLAEYKRSISQSVNLVKPHIKTCMHQD